LVQAATADLKEQNVKGIILDLRNNPGGYLDAAVDVSSEFLKKNDVVVTEKRTTGDKKEHVYKSSGKGKLTDNSVPVVILVNGGSASASEIVSGALVDNGRAILIGEKTFGKGSVQTVENLGQGTTLHVTVAHWYTPKGNNISKAGLTPTVVVPLTDKDVAADKDPQLDKAIEYINSK
jgi:carboxyl-terminal processing protease